MPQLAPTAPKEAAKERWYYQVQQECIHEHWRRETRYEFKHSIVYVNHHTRLH